LPVIAFIFYQKRAEWDKIKQSKEFATMNDDKILDKMQQILENQVRSVIKKGRFTGVDNARAALFMIDPSKCTFVILEPEIEFGQKKFMNDFMSMMFNLGELEQQQQQQRNSQKIFYARSVSTPNKKPIYPQSIKVTIQNLDKIRDFLERQYDYFAKQMKSSKRYMLPSSFNWYHASFAFEEYMFIKASSNLQQHQLKSRESELSDDKDNILKIDLELEKVKPLVNPDWQFSENRCSQAFNLVKQQFCTEETFTSITSSLNEFVEAAIRTYDAYASGPYQEKFKRELVDELSAWHKSRALNSLDQAPTNEQAITKQILMVYPFRFCEEQIVLTSSGGMAQKQMTKLSKQQVTPPAAKKTLTDVQNVRNYQSPIKAIQLVSLGIYSDYYNPQNGLKVNFIEDASTFLLPYEYSSPIFALPAATSVRGCIELHNLLSLAKQQTLEQQQIEKYKIWIGFEYVEQKAFFVDPKLLAAYISRQQLQPPFRPVKQQGKYRSGFLEDYNISLENIYALKNVPVSIPTWLAETDMTLSAVLSKHSRKPAAMARLKQIVLGIPDSSSCISISPKLHQEIDQQPQPQQQVCNPEQRAPMPISNVTTSTISYDCGIIKKIILPRGHFVSLELLYKDNQVAMASQQQLLSHSNDCAMNMGLSFNLRVAD
jgi:hypothetical protein